MLYILLILTLAITPGAILFWFFWIRDRWDREPWMFLAMLAFWGGVSVVPAAAVEIAYFGLEMKIESIREAAVGAFLCAGLVEESIKFIFIFFLTRKSRFFTEEYDGIIYAVTLGLGFAIIENLFYVIGSFFMGEGGMLIALMRAFTAVPMHALDGVVLGYFIGRAHFMKDNLQAGLTLLLGLLVAIAFHGLYDFFAFLTAVLPEHTIGFTLIGLFWVMFVQWGTALRMVRNAQRRSRHQHIATAAEMHLSAVPVQTAQQTDTVKRFCRHCGNPVLPGNKFCRSCGEAL